MFFTHDPSRSGTALHTYHILQHTTHASTRNTTQTVDNSSEHQHATAGLRTVICVRVRARTHRVACRRVRMRVRDHCRRAPRARHARSTRTRVEYRKQIASMARESPVSKERARRSRGDAPMPRDDRRRRVCEAIAKKRCHSHNNIYQFHSKIGHEREFLLREYYEDRELERKISRPLRRGTSTARAGACELHVAC